MKNIRAEIMGIAASLFLAAGSVGAQGISTIQGNDGTSGTVFDLGGGIKTYSDSRGTTGTIQDLGGGIQTFNFHSTQGRSQSGSIYSFDATAGGNPVTPVPSGPGSPLPPLMPLAPHQVITPNPIPPPSFSAIGHR